MFDQKPSKPVAQLVARTSPHEVIATSTKLTLDPVNQLVLSKSGVTLAGLRIQKRRLMGRGVAARCRAVQLAWPTAVCLS